MIAAFTLVGIGRVNEASDAYASGFRLADRHIIIDTAPADEKPLLVGECLCTVVRWPWRSDYATAVNAGLDFVAETAEPWGCRIDSDERAICPDPAALRLWLAALPPSVAVVLVHHNDGSHTRERFFRLPSRYRFTGRTHEMYPCPENEQAIAPRELIEWSELPKTRAQLRAKFTRDVEMLRADIRDNPKNGAGLYYLGSSLQSLALYAREDGDEEKARSLFNGAIDAFREHRRIDTESGRAWHEGTAWSCYRAAECYLAIGEPDRVLDCVAAGLVLDAGIAELYWIAAVASLVQQRPEQARCWAEGARLHGLGSKAERRRRGHRVVHGLMNGPEEVLAAVLAMTEPKQ